MKKILQLVSIALSGFAFTFVISPAFAAAPDGLGPWADFVVASAQGNTKGGVPVSTVNPARSNPNSALGVAEGDTIDSHFFSLGFGGSITLGFINGISTGAFVVEATNPGYPIESASVEMSADGVNWQPAGNVNQSGQVNVPQGIGCAKFVRITDTSNPNNFSDGTADGYDVDGVKALGPNCQPVTPPTGGGITCATTIIQGNSATVLNTVNGTAKTGGNNANNNTGGTTTIQTGNANTNTKIKNLLNSNVATGGCCCCGGNIKVVIKNNGAGSINQVSI